MYLSEGEGNDLGIKGGGSGPWCPLMGSLVISTVGLAEWKRFLFEYVL